MMVHLGHKISMYYFSCSGGPSVLSIKSPLQNFLSGLRFLHLVDLWVTVHSSTSWAGKYPVGHVTPDMCFFMLRWGRYRLHKKHVGTRYAEPVFLHPVGFTVHVMHSGVSVAQNINALFFILRWDECGFQKK
jgi:hypothetical protein